LARHPEEQSETGDGGECGSLGQHMVDIVRTAEEVEREEEAADGHSQHIVEVQSLPPTGVGTVEDLREPERVQAEDNHHGTAEGVREGEGEGVRERQRQSERQRQTERERQRERGRERQRERETERERKREKEMKRRRERAGSLREGGWTW
jgi:hypothetical protein